MAASFALGGVLLLPVLAARRPRLDRHARRRSPSRCSSARSRPRSPTCSSPAACASLTPGETATLTLAEPLTATGLGVLVAGERPGAAPRSAPRSSSPACSRSPRPPAAATGARASSAPACTRPSSRSRASRPSTRSPPRCAPASSTASSRRASGCARSSSPRRYGVARHSLRAALRALAAEGLVLIEPNRGARVARLAPEDIARAVRAAHRARARGRAARARAQRRPAAQAVHDAVRLMDAVCAQPDPPWSAVVEAHAASTARSSPRPAPRGSSAPTPRSPASCGCS